MCQFISFFVSVLENKIICGDPFSHSAAPVHSCMGDWREAEWTNNGKLTIRVDDGEDLNAYKATVLAKCKTRSELANHLSPSTDLDGNVYYFNDRGFNRIGGPAVIGPDGYRAYYVDDKLHRIDGPAITYPDGTVKYYVDDKLHRIDGPAITHSEGTVEYYVDDKYIGKTEDDLKRYLDDKNRGK